MGIGNLHFPDVFILRLAHEGAVIDFLYTVVHTHGGDKHIEQEKYQ